MILLGESSFSSDDVFDRPSTDFSSSSCEWRDRNDPKTDARLLFCKDLRRSFRVSGAVGMETVLATPSESAVSGRRNANGLGALTGLVLRLKKPELRRLFFSIDRPSDDDRSWAFATLDNEELNTLRLLLRSFFSALSAMMVLTGMRTMPREGNERGGKRTEGKR